MMDCSDKKGGEMRKNQKGFGVIEILLIVAVIGLTVAVGWLFLDRQKNNDPVNKVDSSDNSTETATESPKENIKKADETVNWLSYSSPKNTYSIKVPDGWSIDSLSNSGTDGLWAWSSESIKHVAGQKATITEASGGRGGSSSAFALVYDYKDGNNFNIEGSIQRTYKTDAGYDVSKYYFVEPGREDGMYPAKGTVSYVYDIRHQAKRVAIKHGILPGETDQSSLIEKMVNSLKIN
ncbi:hypothetical protein H6796_01655 [Candidatus Nomurabacteria bacterium]|nr:hypothetical protein [Candidatus Nomurabacteria bacterium]